MPQLLPIPPRNQLLPPLQSASFAGTLLTGLTLCTWGKQNLPFPGGHFTPASAFPPFTSSSRSFPQLRRPRTRSWPGRDSLGECGAKKGWREPGTGVGWGRERCQGLGAGSEGRLQRGALPLSVLLGSCSPRSAGSSETGKSGGNAERCIETLRKTFRAGAQGRIWS